MKSSLFLPFGLLGLASSGYADHHQLSGRLTSSSSSSDLERRSAMSGTLSQLEDSQNLVYMINVTLGGAPFSVMIDTGSSDFWVSSSVPGAVNEGYQAGVVYASGSAQGDVMSATLEFAGFSIQSQFFIEAPQASAAGGADGLIGLGPSSASAVREVANSSVANPPLDRIFLSNNSVSPILAILLQRSDDPDEPYPGDLAVGEVLTSYEDILNQPRLPVTLVQSPYQEPQHWQTLLDVNGIVGPNGQAIPIKTQVTGAKTENATVIFDTGFTFPQVPPSVAEALYGGISGSVLTNISGLGEIWVLPCDAEVNASFYFAGVQFPIHPLDLNFGELNMTADGQSYCIGAFQPYSFDIEEDDEIVFDMILGMAFLRNAYLLVNPNNLLNAATPSTDSAYIQLLPLTNATQASLDFQSVRNNSGGLSASQLQTLFNSTGPVSSSGHSIAPWLIGVIAGVGLLVILVVFGILYCCCRRRRGKNVSVPGNVWNAQSYRPIHDPSPQPAYDIHMAPGSTPGYTPAYVPQYKTAWDSRY